MSTSMNDFNQRVIGDFRANGGRVGEPLEGRYHNLKANPDVQIEVGAETFDAVASEATGEERDRLYDAQKERVSSFADYEQKTDRRIPVIVLTPAGS